MYCILNSKLREVFDKMRLLNNASLYYEYSLDSGSVIYQ